MLCDLGVSITVMPKKIFDKLNYSTLTPTLMCLQLANQSVRYHARITKTILVKIRNFFVPMDFVACDMQEDMKTPLILGRPFLSTTNAHIDVEPEKSNSISTVKKSDSPSSQDQNNALIWNGVRNKFIR